MLAYKFEKVGTDDYVLKYKNITGNQEETPFKRTVQMAQKIQGITVKARIKMYKEMTSYGITKNDLIIETKNSDGTTSYDETNYREYEKNYTEIVATEVIGEIIKDSFGEDLDVLLRDMGVDITKIETNEVVKKNVLEFLVKFNGIIAGKEEQEEIPSSEELL